MSNPALVLLWGSPSSGKTVTALKLAQALTAKRKNVLILCSDALCPSIASICPQQANDQPSLGELLSLPTVSQDDVLRYSLPVKSNPHLAFLGYKKGDHPFSYPNYSHERVSDVLTLARHTADIVLVDGASYFANQLLTTAALERADLVLRFHTADLKSMMFYDSYLPLLSDSRFKQAKTLSLLSNVKPGQDSRTYRQVVGDISVELPHAAVLEQQTWEAKLLEPLPASKDSNAYEQALMQLLQVAFPSVYPPLSMQQPLSNEAASSPLQRLKEAALKLRGEKH